MKNVRYPALMTAALVLAAVPSAFAFGPERFPNSTPYRVTQGQKATGRSGNATLTARAVQSQNGTVTLEVTTGALNSSAVAPGTITKLQVKSFDGTGEGEVFTRNYTGLNQGGALTYTYTAGELVRGQPFMVQANIKGIDRNRTDVVTVSGNVRVLPDLSVSQLTLPARAPVGTPVNISALIEELNADMGANANCVLSVNGQPVDEANGIWVDASGQVSCAFTHNFRTEGVQNVTVSLQNVAPADYDLGNNSRSASINVVVPQVQMAWSANARNRVFDYASTVRGFYRQADGSYATEPDWVTTTVDQGWHQVAVMDAWTSTPVTFPLTRVVALQKSGDTVVQSSDVSNVAAMWTYEGPNGAVGRCAGRFDKPSETLWQVCSHGGATPATTILQNRYAGQVVYYSRVYGTHWHSWVGSYDWSWAQGSQLALGSNYEMRVEVISGETNLLAHANLAFNPININYSNPYTCANAWTGNSRQGQQCTQSHGVDSGGEVTASFEP